MKATVFFASAAALAGLALGGCSQQGGAGNATANATANVTTNASGNAAAPAANAASSAPANATAPAAESSLALLPEGLRVTGAGGAERDLMFGTPHDAVMAAIASRGDGDESVNEECGAGPLSIAVWADGLSLLFQDGKFAGWTLDERADAIEMTNGIGIGTSRAALEELSNFQVEESTLGTEFTSDAVGGLLSGKGKDAKVTGLWSGTTCMFR